MVAVAPAVTTSAAIPVAAPVSQSTITPAVLTKSSTN